MTERKNHKSLRDDQMMTSEERAGMELVFHEAAHGVVAAALGAKIYSLTTGHDSGRLHCSIFRDEDLPVGSVHISDPQFRLITKDCTVGLAGIYAVMRFSQVTFWEGVQRGGWSDYLGVNNLASPLRPEIRPFMIDQAKEWAEAIVEAEWGLIGMIAKLLAYENTAQETYIHVLLNKFGTEWEFAPWNDAHWNEFVGSYECDDQVEAELREPLWSAAHPHSNVSGTHPSLGGRHLAKAGETDPDADRKGVGE